MTAGFACEGFRRRTHFDAEVNAIAMHGDGETVAIATDSITKEFGPGVLRIRRQRLRRTGDGDASAIGTGIEASIS